MKIAIIGGGAAGFFFAVNAARMYPTAEITIYEQSEKVLQKVRISGGGRCNVTHHCFEPAELVKKYPRGERELRQLFARFQPQDTINWFTQRGVSLKIEKDGRIFPEANKSEAVIDCLLQEATQFGVSIAYKMGLSHITPGSPFQLHFKNGATITADILLIACGGFADAKKYDFLKDLGHKIISPIPSLFTFNIKEKSLHELAGISFEGRVEIGKRKYEGAMLITHWGLSGPAILRASAYEARTLNECFYHFPLKLAWTLATELEIETALKIQKQNAPKKRVVNSPILQISSRLWAYICYLSKIDDKRLNADLSTKEIKTCAEVLRGTFFEVKGKSTFKEEFVTAGGVALKEVDLRTMQSKIVPHLYFAGEVLNVDGITGGFNFQHAWSSAWVAANGILP